MFAVVLVVSVGGAATSTLLVNQLARGNQSAAQQLKRELDVVSSLRQSLHTEHAAVHAVFDSEHAAAEFLRADDATRALLEVAMGDFDGVLERALLGQVRARWDRALSLVRSAVQSPGGATRAHRAEFVSLHDTMDAQMLEILAILDKLAETALEPVDNRLDEGKRAAREQLAILYVLLALSLCTTVYLGRRTKKDIVSPIHKLREATRRLGAGDFDHRVDVDRDDEFGELASTFNAMADTLDANRRELSAQLYGQARLASIVESSDQAILGLSPDLVVTSWNPGAERLYGHTAEEAIGREVFDLLLPGNKPAGDTFLHRVANGDRVSGHETEVQVRDGRVIPISVAASPIVDHAGIVVGISSIAEDISERKSLEERLHHQAFHDPLTNLANRALLNDRLEHALARQARSGGLLGMIMLDLDDFKAINDSLGHRAGDELLVSVADRLRACTREADTLARLGGDEFAILLEDLHDPAEAVSVTERVLEALSARFFFEGQSFPVSASLGLALAGADAATLDDVIRDADVAMYLTKNSAKGGYTVFEAGMHLAVKQRLRLKADLARAMGSDELAVHYQPIVDLHSGDIVGVEALARWRHPELGMVSPAEFIPVAEETGLIVPLGLWVLETACREATGWQHTSGASPTLRVSVNVSGRQLEDQHFVANVAHILDRLDFDPTRVVLEITESVFVCKAEESIDKLHQLKRLGVQLAIDDFGTGYSSLSSLQQLPVDILKIDKSFIDRLDGNDEQGVLARAVLGLGRTLQLETVAEGVESGTQLSELRKLECTLAQGYYFARPADAATVAALLQEDVEKELRRPGRTAAAPVHAETVLTATS
ncbi:MAG: EAL domain-containing protein [Acidimicrobiia bacterium]